MFAHYHPFKKNLSVRATGAVFIASGILLGTWTVLIPYLKSKFTLDESELGLLLLCLPAGVTVTNPFTVPMMRRFGVVNSTSMSQVFAAVMFAMPILLPDIWLVAISLFFTGASYSCLNITMNTCASEMELQGNMRIISTMHGLWSLGAMAGSAVTGAIIGGGMEAPTYVLGLLFFNLVFIFLVRKPLMGVPEPVPSKTNEKKQIFIWPNRVLWVLIIIGLCVSLTEGSMTDWAGVYMRETLSVPETRMGWGFATYALFMASGRLLGDGLIGIFGSRRLLQFCGILAFSGLMILAANLGLAFSLLGFMLTGAGVSIGAPILYAESAKVPGLPTGAGLATFNTFAMLGFLGGPAFIGFLADAWSLPAALGVVGAGAAVWAVFSGRM